MPPQNDNPPLDRPANNGGGGKPPQEVAFTLDGKRFSVAGDKLDAADILRLGGLDPSGYDLRRLRPGNAPDKPYDDDQRVHIKDGDVFLSVRHSAQVA